MCHLYFFAPQAVASHLNHHNERRYGEADAEHPRPRAERSRHLLP